MNQSHDNSAWRECAAGELQQTVHRLKARRRDRQLAKVVAGVGCLLVVGLVAAIALNRGPNGDQPSFGRISCRQVRANLVDYRAGRTDAKLAAQIREHLATCPHCQQFYEQMKSDDTAWRAAGQAGNCLCRNCVAAPRQLVDARDVPARRSELPLPLGPRGEGAM